MTGPIEAALDRGELRLDLVLQCFASAERSTGYAGAFHVAPYQFIRVQLRGVAGRKCSVSIPSVEAT
jgi:hypothetical protein